MDGFRWQIDKLHGEREGYVEISKGDSTGMPLFGGKLFSECMGRQLVDLHNEAIDGVLSAERKGKL